MEAPHPIPAGLKPTDPRCVFFTTQQSAPNSTPASPALEQLQRDIELGRAANLSHDPDRTLVLASRNSQLALIQSSFVSSLLSSHFSEDAFAFEASSASLTPSKAAEIGVAHPHTFPITSMSTAGDNNLRSPLYVIGGEGRAIWTKELEVALKAGAVDAIVHCLKDVPTVLPEGLELAAILEREDPRDALVVKNGLPYKTLDELPAGSVIGTSSVRRVAQLRKRYPSLVFSDVRGNLNTRLAKLDSPTGPYTALVLAAAGLIRLSLAGRITAFLSAPVLLHSVGQGSLAVEIRSPPANADPHTNREARIARMVARIGDWRATWRAEAERGLLRELEGGCSIPVGVESRFDDHDEVEGKRNEGAAVREVDAAIAPEAPLDTPPVHKVGHVIPASQLAERSQQTRPATLERLATGASQSTTAQNAGESAPSDAPSHLTASANAALSHYSEPEDRSVAPAEGATLHLHAVVVSLDGARSASYTLSGHCTSAAEARDLGVRVARELRDVRGAREILEEVERHRMIAEQADERRRRGEGDKGAQPPGCALRVGEDDLQVQAQAQKKQAQNALDVLVPAPNGEMDRRGLPRDDGQLKAWEV